ncbi:MAG: PEP-CTERM sorting domain-containing protein [Bryobacteraceae bacterium]|nr:PEP-CTERM sorting domain-containing protein [Bryobacteraceae bacterium]
MRWLSLMMASLVNLRADIAGPEVPEPSTWMLMAAGFGALVWGVRKNRTRDH